MSKYSSFFKQNSKNNKQSFTSEQSVDVIFDDLLHFTHTVHNFDLP